MARANAGFRAESNDRAENHLVRWLPVVVVLGGILLAVGSFWLIVDSAQTLRDKSESSAEQASRPTVPSVEIVQARAQFDQSSARTITLTVTVSQGIDAVAVPPIRLVLQANGAEVAGSVAGGTVVPIIVRDADGSLEEPDPVLNRGDLLELELNVQEHGLLVEPSDMVTIQLLGTELGTDSEWQVPPGAAGRLVTLGRLG